MLLAVALLLGEGLGRHAAAETLEVLPHAPHPRQVVLELCELHLQLPLGRDGVLGEDVEDQLRPVDDSGREGILERLLLRRRELVVDDEDVGLELLERLLELAELPLSDVGSRVGRHAMLDDVAARLDARGPCELAELVELRGGIDSLRDHREHEPTFGLGARAGIRLAHRHDAQSCR